MKKITYKTIYAFEALDALKAGERLRVLDKKTEKVIAANEMFADYFVEAISSTEKDRFEFWIVENSGEETDE